MATYTVDDPEKRFFLHGGGELNSLEELFVELQTMEPHVYAHHVSVERNDFANWVRDVMEDRSLARRIGAIQEKDDLLKLLFMSFFR